MVGISRMPQCHVPKFCAEKEKPQMNRMDDQKQYKQQAEQQVEDLAQKGKNAAQKGLIYGRAVLNTAIRAGLPPLFALNLKMKAHAEETGKKMAEQGGIQLPHFINSIFDEPSPIIIPISPKVAKWTGVGVGAVLALIGLSGASGSGSVSMTGSALAGSAAANYARHIKDGPKPSDLFPSA